MATRRARRQRLPELVAAAVVVVLGIVVIAVVVLSRDDKSVETDASPEELLEAAALRFEEDGRVSIGLNGDVELTPEIGELSLGDAAVQAIIYGDGQLAVPDQADIAIRFEVTDGPLPAELGPSQLDTVVVDGQTWTRLDGDEWESTEVPEGVIPLPQLDSPDEVLRLAIEEGDDLTVAETTEFDGETAHRVSVRLTPEALGLQLEQATTEPARVDFYISDDDQQMTRMDIAVDGQFSDPVPAQARLRLQIHYYAYGAPVDITAPTD